MTSIATRTPTPVPAPSQRSARDGLAGWAARAGKKLALVGGAVVGIGLVWTGYKAMGEATDGTWPFTDRELPVPTDDTTLPPFLDIFTRFFEPQRPNDPTDLWRFILDAAFFTFRTALVGFVCGIILGLGLALVMVRSRWLERGMLPYIIISQTVPLIAIAPLVVAWGNQIDIGFFDWQTWMSVAIIATYLTFFPVSVGALRGLKSPPPARTRADGQLRGALAVDAVQAALPGRGAIPHPRIESRGHRRGRRRDRR